MLGMLSNGSEGVCIHLFGLAPQDERRIPVGLGAWSDRLAAHASGTSGGDRRMFSCQTSFNTVMVSGAGFCKLFSLKPETFGEQIVFIAGVVEAAISPDAIFLAVIVSTLSITPGLVHECHELQIYAVASGRLLHKYRPEGMWCASQLQASECGSCVKVKFNLKWAGKGMRLLVEACSHSSLNELTAAGAAGKTQSLLIFSF